MNMFIYCGNDPINRTDPSGHFWKEIKEFFNKAVQRISFVVSTLCELWVLAPLKSAKIEIGAGSGFGFDTEIESGNFALSVDAGVKYYDSISVSKSGFDAGSNAKVGVSLGIPTTGFSIEAGYQKYHSFSDNKCTCDILREGIGNRALYCPAAKTLAPIQSPKLGVTIGVFCILGVEVSCELDLVTYFQELQRVNEKCMNFRG